MAKQARDTKSRILKATRSLYSAHGCDATTLDDIITASGVTKGAFYHYFKGKETLCEAVVGQAVADFEDLVKSVNPDLAPLEQLRQIIHKLAVLNASGEWVNCRLMLRLSIESHQGRQEIQHKIRSFWKWYTNFYRQLVQKCRDSGELTKDIDTQTLTTLLMSTMAGAIILERATESQVKPAELTDAIINLFRR